MNALRWECPSCERLVAPASVRVEEGEVVLTCARCAAEGRLTLSVPRALKVAVDAQPLDAVAPPPGPRRLTLAPALDEAGSSDSPFGGADPFEVPEGHCPKCVERKLGEELACRQCGLVFDGGFVVPGAHESLRPLWRETVARWGEAAAHRAFIERARSLEQLTSAGFLYRLALARRPGDTHALRSREELIRLALTPALKRSEATDPKKKARAVTLAVMLVVTMVLLLAIVSVLLG